MKHSSPDWREALIPRFGNGWSPYVSCGDGWKDIIIQLVADLDATGLPWSVHQIKEKYGVLCFYASVTTPGDEWLRQVAQPGYILTDFDKKLLSVLETDTSAARKRFEDLIRDAERKSGVTCEGCGAPGKRSNHKYTTAWIQTLCDKCDRSKRKDIEKDSNES